MISDKMVMGMRHKCNNKVSSKLHKFHLQLDISLLILINDYKIGNEIKLDHYDLKFKLKHIVTI